MDEFDLSPDDVRRLGQATTEVVAEHRAALLEADLVALLDEATEAARETA